MFNYRSIRGVVIGIDDVVVTRKIFERFSKEFQDCFDIDVAIAGAGPAGLTAAKYLANAGKKVVILGSGNVGLIVAYQLVQAGADVVGVIDMLPKISGYQVHAGKIRRIGIPIMTSYTIQEALGKIVVEGAKQHGLPDSYVE